MPSPGSSSTAPNTSSPKTSDHPYAVPAPAAAAAWALLAAFVLYGSSGVFSDDGRHASALPGFSAPDIIQNVLLYVPFGTFGAWAIRRRCRSSPVPLWIAAIALVYSTLMEVLQTTFAARIPSALDVAANVAGAGIGVWAAPAIERAIGLVRDQFRAIGLLSAPARYLLLVVLTCIVAYAWYPFDITLDVSTLSERTKAVRRDPWLRPDGLELWRQALSFFVLASVTTFSVPRLGRYGAIVSAVATIVAALIIDLGQIGMGRYPIGVAAFLSQSVGACAGVAGSLVAARARDGWYAAA